MNGRRGDDMSTIIVGPMGSGKSLLLTAIEAEEKHDWSLVSLYRKVYEARIDKIVFSPFNRTRLLERSEFPIESNNVQSQSTSGRRREGYEAESTRTVEFWSATLGGGRSSDHLTVSYIDVPGEAATYAGLRSTDGSSVRVGDELKKLIQGANSVVFVVPFWSLFSKEVLAEPHVREAAEGTSFNESKNLDLARDSFTEWLRLIGDHRNDGTVLVVLSQFDKGFYDAAFCASIHQGEADQLWGEFDSLLNRRQVYEEAETGLFIAGRLIRRHQRLRKSMDKLMALIGRRCGDESSVCAQTRLMLKRHCDVFPVNVVKAHNPSTGKPIKLDDLKGDGYKQFSDFRMCRDIPWWIASRQYADRLWGP